MISRTESVAMVDRGAGLSVPLQRAITQVE
jgi:hypothetical protein